MGSTPRESKTKPTALTVDQFLAGAGPERQEEARALCDLMSAVTGEPPTMWGPSIIGFGRHAYRYESGREGVTPAVAFSPRTPAIVFYGLGETARDAPTLAKLGRATCGKGCVYVKRLRDVDLALLRELIAAAFAQRRSAPA